MIFPKPVVFRLSALSFSRTSPLKVRLEHRELACRYSAYAFLENSRTSAADAAAAGQDDTKGPGQAHHLVFSYDPSALSACGKAPFSYLEGQSVAFVNLVDTRKGFSEQKQGTPKPRLYSLASSPAAPEVGLHHSFSLVGFIRGAAGWINPVSLPPRLSLSSFFCRRCFAGPPPLNATCIFLSRKELFCIFFKTRFFILALFVPAIFAACCCCILLAASPQCVKHHLYWGPEGHRDPSKDGLCSALLCTVPIGTSFEIGGKN